jgi:hypothetical protein
MSLSKVLTNVTIWPSFYFKVNLDPGKYHQSITIAGGVQHEGGAVRPHLPGGEGGEPTIPGIHSILSI